MNKQNIPIVALNIFTLKYTSYSNMNTTVATILSKCRKRLKCRENVGFLLNILRTYIDQKAVLSTNITADTKQ